VNFRVKKIKEPGKYKFDMGSIHWKDFSGQNLSKPDNQQ
jgi:hypothetical protein